LKGFIMAGFDNVYQLGGKGNNFRLECGDPSYFEVSSTYVSVPTTLTKIFAGFLMVDGSNASTATGRASQRIGDPSDGVLDFSLADATSTDTVTYIAVGW
jgi:hypothetical protein